MQARLSSIQKLIVDFQKYDKKKGIDYHSKIVTLSKKVTKIIQEFNKGHYTQADLDAFLRLVEQNNYLKDTYFTFKRSQKLNALPEGRFKDAIKKLLLQSNSQKIDIIIQNFDNLDKKSNLCQPLSALFRLANSEEDFEKISAFVDSKLENDYKFNISYITKCYYYQNASPEKKAWIDGEIEKMSLPFVSNWMDLLGKRAISDQEALDVIQKSQKLEQNTRQSLVSGVKKIRKSFLDRKRDEKAQNKGLSY